MRFVPDTDPSASVADDRPRGSVKFVPLEPDRMTVGSVARDIASGLLQIGPTAVKGAADIARLATGDTIGVDLSQAMERGMRSIREIVGSERAQQQRDNFELDMADDRVGLGQALLRNKGALADQLLPTVGSMMLPVGVSSAAGGLANVSRAAQALTAAERAARASRAATVASYGTVAAQNAADTFAGLRDRPEQADLGDAYLGAAVTVPFSLAAGRLTRGGAEGAIGRALSGQAAQRGVLPVLKASGFEAAQETGEELGQVFGEAAATRELPSATSAAKQLAVAGILGGVMGGGVDVAQQTGLFGRDAPAPIAPPAPTPAQPTQPQPGATAAPPVAPVAPTTSPTAPTSAPPTTLDVEADPVLADLQTMDLELQQQIAGLQGRDDADAEMQRLDLEAQRQMLALTMQGLQPTPAVDVEAPAVDAAAPAPADQEEDAAPVSSVEQEAAVDAPAAVDPTPAVAPPPVVAPATSPDDPANLQNRDRTRIASIAQMQSIAAAPDYMRLGPSRTPDSGAPMAFAPGDQAPVDPRAWGREDVAVMSDGQRVPFRYAVVDAASLQPSNFADGSTNPSFTSAQPGSLIALNNGRSAGLREAWSRGTAERYKAELVSDAPGHGVDPAAIAMVERPVLVRIYSQASNTPGMAARSQGQGLGMSPAELARQDAPLIDSSVLSVYAGGDVTQAGNRDFVRAFVGKLQAAGQDIAPLIDAQGMLSQPGRRRIDAALMAAAYDDVDLVSELYESNDTDIAAIGGALRQSAGRWAQLRDLARSGAVEPGFDITQPLMGAVRMVQRARRDKQALFDLARQVDLETGEAPDELTVEALRVLYGGQNLTRARGRDKVSSILTQYADAATSAGSGGGLFGDAPSPLQALRALTTDDKAPNATLDQPPAVDAPGLGALQAPGRAPDGGQPPAAGPADRANAGGNGQAGQRPGTDPQRGGADPAGTAGAGPAVQGVAPQPAAAPESRLDALGADLFPGTKDEVRAQMDAAQQRIRDAKERRLRATQDAILADDSAWKGSPFADRIRAMQQSLADAGEAGRGMLVAISSGINIDAKNGRLTEQAIAHRESVARRELANIASAGKKPQAEWQKVTPDDLRVEPVIASLPVELASAAADRLNELGPQLAKLGFRSHLEVDARAPAEAQSLAQQMRDIEGSLLTLAPARYMAATGDKRARADKLGSMEDFATSVLGVDTRKIAGVDTTRQITADGVKTKPIPTRVLGSVQRAVANLQELHRELTEVDRVGGPTELTLRSKERAPRIRAAIDTLTQFRALATKQGVDPEAVIANAGGEPDFRPFQIQGLQQDALAPAPTPAQSAPAAPVPDQPLLVSPTPEEVVARQDAVEAERRQKEAADRQADEADRRRAQQDEIRRRSEAAADTFELGQDPMVNLSGQQDIFAAPEAETGATDKPSQPEPDALALTPKQYHEARLRYIADRNGIDMPEVRQNYDDVAGRAESNREWAGKVEQAARGGAVLTRQTLDKLFELRPTAQVPESSVPNGYQRPEARKAEKDAKALPTEEEIRSAARYLKDFAYSVQNLDGMSKRAMLTLSNGPLSKSGRDTLLMGAFGLTRDQAHDINNRLDAAQPRTLRNEDMQEAFDVFPGLRKVVDDALASAIPAKQVSDGPTPQYKAGDRLTPDADVIEGDIVRHDGRLWMARVKRGNTVPLAPIMDGKPQVNADSVIRVNVVDNEVVHTGANVYGHGGQPTEVPASAQAAPRGYGDLEKIAERLGVRTFKAAGGWHASGDGGVVDIPDADVDVTAQGAVSPAHVFAHELGHVVMKKRGVSFAGFPKAEILRRIPNWDDVVAASKAFRPKVHQHENERFRKHAQKPNEVIADAIASVLLGASDISMLRPMMQSIGLTDADLGLDPATASSQPVARIDDAGQKIGGARKDRWKDRGLDVSDLDEMTESEGAGLAVKANVWKPDYEQLSSDADPVTAAMVKVVYDGLAAKPKDNTPSGRRNYVRAMQAVRKVYGGVRSVEQAKDAFHALRVELGVERANGRGFEATRDKDALAVLFSVYKGRTDPFVMSATDLVRARDLVKQGFPSIEPWKRRFTVTKSGQGYTDRGIANLVDESTEVGTPMTPEQIRQGVYFVTTKAGKRVAFGVTLEDAQAAAAALYERHKGGDEKDEPTRPHLDNLERRGLPQRIDRDVTPEDFLQAFGWRGIEFGNWAAQDERQRLLNMAYDALMDLAQIVNVPPLALSLNGTMGLAFGARGGGKFAAHYEPGKLVINMTKLRGAGSLAHEWAHALDHYLGELGREDAYQGNARGATGWYERASYTGAPQPRIVQRDGKYVTTKEMRLSNLRPELAVAVDRLMQKLYATPIPQQEAISIQKEAISRTEQYMADAKDQEIKSSFEQQLAAQRKILADLESGAPTERTKRSSYATEAQRLSGKSTTGYWVRPTEMFARAFEAYVFDMLVAMGAQSDYLVHGVEQDRYADQTRYKGNPYPTGAERAAINALFDELVGTFKTRETPKGVEVFEEAAVYKVKNPAANYDLQHDLFPETQQDLQFVVDRQPLTRRESTPAGTNGRKRARTGAPVATLSVRQDPAMPGVYHYSSQLVQVAQRELPVSSVRSWSDAASALASMGRYAVEHFDVLITDKAGKPLAVVGSFKGALSQASVYPGTVLAEALRIEGAARAWGVHNHPSGNPELSRADEHLSQALGNAFDGSSVEWMGLSAIGADRFTAVGGGAMPTREGGPLIQGETKLTIPVVERTILRNNAGQLTLSSPQEAVRAVQSLTANEPGILFMDAQHKITAWVPVDPAEMETLRKDGRFDRLVNSATQAGSGAAMISNPGGAMSDRAMTNIATLLNRIDVRLLDAVDPVTGASAAERGNEPRAAGTVFSRGAAGEPMTAERVQQVASTIAGRWARAPEVVVLESMQDPKTPKEALDEDALQRKNGATGSPRGFFLDGKVYLVADGMTSITDVAETLAHEGLGHYGLRAVFGKALDAILDQIAAARGDLMRPKAVEYGKVLTPVAARARIIEQRRREGLAPLHGAALDSAAEAMALRHRRQVAEEVLTTLAQTQPELHFVKRVVAAIRTWLRNNIQGFADLRLTDEEIIRSYILPARGWVERGESGRLPGGAVALQRAWHGSPHRGIEQFSTDAIGTGEGAQAYGWGIYLASLRDVAEYYRKKLSQPQPSVTFPYGDDERYVRINSGWAGESSGNVLEGADHVAAEALYSGDDLAKAIADAEINGFDEVVLGNAEYSVKDAREALRIINDKDVEYDEVAGQLYEVEIPEDSDMLLWDKPLSKQPANVRKVLHDGVSRPTTLQRTLAGMDVKGLLAWAKAFDRNSAWDEEVNEDTTADELRGWLIQNYGDEDMADYMGGGGFDAGRTGESIYRELATKLGSDRAASEALLAAGIKGIKYLDGTSRPDGDGSHNYVIFDGADTEIVGTAFSRNSIGPNPPPQPAANIRNRWQALKQRAMNLTDPETIDKLIYEFQDRFVDLKRIRDHVAKLGGTVTDLNDAYLGEELFHKRLATRTQAFLDDELRPLLADLKARGVALDDFERFLHARHAPEANAAMAKRNPSQAEINALEIQAEADLKGLRLKLQAAQAKGSSTTALEQSVAMAQERLAEVRRMQPFPGTEDERMSLSGMSDADAAALMAALTPAQRADLDALADQVDRINAKTLDALQAYGLVDKAMLDSWRQQYLHYVPLHRDEAHPQSYSHPVGQGYNVRGVGVRQRVGSNQKVTHILGHIAMQREAALTRGEKNVVLKKLYLLVGQNPLRDVWRIDNPPMTKTVDPVTGTVKRQIDGAYRNQPNVVTLRIAGKDASIIFSEQNPQAMRLASTLKNLEVGDLHAVVNTVARITRYFASINTQYNPIFGVVNMLRDVQAAALNLSTTALRGKELQVLGDVPAALRAVYRKERGKGAANADNARWIQLWKDLELTGGATGYRDLYSNAEDRAKSLQRELEALNRGQVSKAAFAVLDWLSDYNEAMENAVRVSAYKQALDSGMSKERAASLAKNLTVNFNRKGNQTREIGAFYAFFNAALQGTTRMAQTLSGPSGRRIMAGGVALGVLNTLLGMAAMGGGGGDDDEWSKIPDFIKERNLIIPISGKDYITLPLPLGFHFLPNIGRLTTELALGGSDKTAGKQAAAMVQILMDAFNPLGGAQNVGQMLTPTVFDPIVALLQNRDWTGRPIYREDRNPLDPQPGSALAKDAATPWARGIAEALNRISGGTKFQPGMWSPTPDQIDYIIGQLTGGVGREIGKVATTISAPITGDELPAYKIPGLSRFYGNVRGSAGQSDKFYENIKTLNMVENELQGRAKAGEDIQTYLKDEPLASLAGAGNAYARAISELRKQRREMRVNKPAGYQDQVRQIDEQITRTMADLNAKVQRAQAPQAVR